MGAGVAGGRQKRRLSEAMMGVITDLFRFLNYAEAAFWIACAMAAAGIGLRRRGRTRSRCLLLAGTLVLFGLSDVIETRTGAWWRPWWLFVWKAACVAVMLALLIEHYRLRWIARRQPAQPQDTGR